MPGTKLSPRKMSDIYFALIKEFPLAPLRDEDDLDAAEAVLDRLLTNDLDEGGEAYLDVLTGLVQNYEEAHHPIHDASEAEVLRHLLESNSLTQADFARTVAISASTVSSVLNGVRSLTKSQLVKVASFFRVSPAVFLPGKTS